MAYEIALTTNGEPLVSDARLEKVFYQFQQFREYPQGTAFATFIQEPNEKEKRRLAVFMVVSDHPRKVPRAITPRQVITMSAMPLERWREQEKQHKHYAKMVDPIRPIFAGLLRRHMKHYDGLKDLD